MKETYENITPKLAEKYLNANTNNRPLREGHAEKMVADMQAGAWTYCTSPIVFYDDGSLADGQHRLWAVVTSGQTFRFLVIRGLPKAAGINIDTGVSRNVVDVARIHGIDPSMSHAIAAVARGVEDGVPSQGKRGRTISEMLVVLAKHRVAAHWAVTHGPFGRGMRNAAILSAIARAYYTEKERERLAHFGRVVSKGFADTPEDSAAIAMRNYLIQKLQAKQNVSGSGLWRDTFLKSQNALYQFMRHKPLTMIKVVADESYPLAELADGTVTVTKRGAAAAARAVRKGRKY